MLRSNISELHLQLSASSTFSEKLELIIKTRKKKITINVVHGDQCFFNIQQQSDASHVNTSRIYLTGGKKEQCKNDTLQY